MDEAIQKEFYRKEYHETFLRCKSRCDGRRLDEFRPLAIQLNVISTSDGSAFIRHGDTLIVAAIKAELYEPDDSQPDRGTVEICIHSPFQSGNSVSNVADERFSSEVNFWRETLQSLLDSDILFDRRALCIRKAKLCWKLFCDLVILNEYPSLNCCLTALTAALSSTTLPTVQLKSDSEQNGTTNEELEKLFNENSKPGALIESGILIDRTKRSKLSNVNVMAAASFLILRLQGTDQETMIMADPSSSELSAIDDVSRLTLVIGGNDRLHGTFVNGHVSTASLLTKDDSNFYWKRFDKCLRLAVQHRTVVDKLLKAMESDSH